MTINYTPDGGSSVSLAGAEDTLEDGPKDLQGGTTAAVQSDDGIRTAKPFRQARGNRTFECSFTAKKKHASYEAAQLYWMAHIRAFNNIGACVFTKGSSVLTVSAASIDAQGQCMGATSVWTYRVTGTVDDA